MAAAPIGMAAGLAGGIIGAIGNGPSQAMINLNNQVQSFSQAMQSQAKSEGIDASTTFQNLMTPLQRIVQGGPNQAGWSQAQFNAFNTQAIQSSAAYARDAKALVGNSVPGGPAIGNTGTQGVNTAAIADKAEQAASAAESSGIEQSYAQGNENFFKAANEEKELPGVFATSNSANEGAASELKNAEISQQNIDTAKRSASWQGIISKSLSGAGGAAIGGAVQNGIGNMSKDSTTLENVGNFGKGLFGSGITGNDAGPSATQKAVNTPVATTTSTLPDELTPSAGF
jgi:hypothetical protein